MNKIAIVNSSSFGKYFPDHLTRLKALGEIEFFTFPSDIEGKELALALKDYNLIIASVTPFFTEAFFVNHPGCKLITRHGIGYNNIHLPSATKHGCFVSKVEGIVEQDAVAENAIALLMNLTRMQSPAEDACNQGEWKTRANYLGYQVRNKTVGIIGYGNIGSRVGSILKGGFNCRILAFDPYQDVKTIQDAGAEVVDLSTLLKKADIISLNAFLSKENYHLLGEAEIQQMKDHVIIVNTARGELVDDHAIVNAVKQGKIFGYGADVVEGEPIIQTHHLLNQPRIIVTPHISAYTYECLEGMGDKCVSDCEKVVQGDVPGHLINIELIQP